MKLKIHFLEESLSKSGSGLNEAALKENTALKVDRVTLQKDLSRAKATLGNAERELETYRRHLQAVQEEMKRKHADEDLREELEVLRSEVASKTSEVLDLKQRLECGENKEEEIDRLHDMLSETEEQLRTSQHGQIMSDEKVQALEDEVASKVSEILDLEQRVESAEGKDEEIDRLHEMLSDSEERLRVFQQEQSTSDEKVQALEDEISSKASEVLDLKQKLESRGSREEEISRLYAVLSETKEQLRASQYDKLITGEKVQCLENEVASKASEVLDLKQRLESEKGEEEEIARLHAVLSETREELRTSQRDRKLSDEKVQPLEDEIHELRTSQRDRNFSDEKVQALEDELEELRTSQRDRNLCDEKLQALEDEVEELRASERDQRNSDEKVQALEDELEVLQANYDDEVEASEVRDRELQAAAQNIQLLETQVAQLKSRLGQGEQGEEVLREILRTLTGEVDSKESEIRDLKRRLESVQSKGEISRGYTAEELDKLRAELSDTQEKLRVAQGRQTISDENFRVRERELLDARQKIRVVEIENGKLAQSKQEDDTAALFERDLAAARTKETEYMQRETIHRENIRDLKQQVARLERQLHEVEISRLAESSPQSSPNSSARKTEIVEVRRQLAEAHQQIKDSRAKSKERERELQRQIVESNNQAQSDKDELERERDHLELELSSCRMQHDQQFAKNASIEVHVARLRSRLHDVEKDLRAQRESAAGDMTMAAERKELHEMLKDAKLTEESLQHEVSSRETLLAASSSREKELRVQIQRIREERNLQHQKTIALSRELEQLQIRYERAVDNLSRQQKSSDEERKRLKSELQSGDATLQLSLRGKEKRHERELRILASQANWLRAQCRREEGFRRSLTHGKQYLLKQIEQHNAFTSAQLNVLQSMGIRQSAYPPPPLSRNATEKERCQYELDIIRDPASMRPTVKSVGLMIVAVGRMRKLAKGWAEKKERAEAVLVKRREEGDNRRRRSEGLMRG